MTPCLRMAPTGPPPPPLPMPHHHHHHLPMPHHQHHLPTLPTSTRLGVPQPPPTHPPVQRNPLPTLHRSVKGPEPTLLVPYDACIAGHTFAGFLMLIQALLMHRDEMRIFKNEHSKLTNQKYTCNVI